MRLVRLILSISSVHCIRICLRSHSADKTNLLANKPGGKKTNSTSSFAREFSQSIDNLNLCFTKHNCIQTTIQFLRNGRSRYLQNEGKRFDCSASTVSEVMFGLHTYPYSNTKLGGRLEERAESPQSAHQRQQERTDRSLTGGPAGWRYTRRCYAEYGRRYSGR